MSGLPLNNPALHVEAVGFDDWQGLALGVLIAPWTLNLMLLPNGNERFRALALDEKQTWRFPSGDYEFMGGDDDELGPYQFCSLFSPAFEFDSQDEARAVAVEVLAALRRPDAAAAVEVREQARLTGQPTSEQPLSRRGFLRGGFLGGRG